MMRYFRLTLIPLAMAVFLSLAACSSVAQIDPAAGLFDQLGSALGQGTAVLAPDAPPSLPAATTFSPAAAAAVDGQLATIYTQVNPSVVHIRVTTPIGELPADHIDVPDLPDMPPQAIGEGSGFVWDEAGHIVTNNHVVDGAQKITVFFADDTAIDAELIGADPDSDLAVLQVDAPEKLLYPVQLGDSTTLQVGELAIAIGNPFGQEGTMTAGIISALGRLLPVEGVDPSAPRYNIPDVIQTDAAINPGNSGGVLLNGRGEVVGVTTAIISGSRASSGVGFAVPSAIVKQVVPALIENGRYDHPFLGIRGGSLSSELAQALGLPEGQRGVLVAEVTPGGPAAETGLRGSDQQLEIDGLPVEAGGDIIIAADGQAIEAMDDLIAFLERHTKVGQTITLTILRDGQEDQIDVALAARPDERQAALPQLPLNNQAAERNAQPAWLGIAGMALDPQLAEALDLPAGQEGILIQQIEHGSPAHAAGLRGGYMLLPLDGRSILAGGDVLLSVNDDAVVSMEALGETLSQYKPGDVITLRLLRDNEEIEVPVTLAAQPA